MRVQDPAQLPLYVPTHLHGLDSLLGGGLTRGDLTLFFGARGVGKTSLGIQVAVSNALSGSETFLIYCDGAFPAGRLAGIADEGADAASKLIRVATPTSFAEQHKVLERFEVEVNVHPLTSLLIMDSVDSLYKIQLSLLDSWERDGRISEASFMLNKHLGLVTNICRSREIAALITCGARPSEAEPFEEPASARLMDYWSDSVIEMSREADGLYVKPVKLKGRRSPEAGRRLRYAITERGLEEPIDGGDAPDADR